MGELNESIMVSVLFERIQKEQVEEVLKDGDMEVKRRND